MSDTDLELLARYTRHHAEDAFAEIVRRHLDLVHSAALRQVRSPQLAEEVAQSVFTDLACNAQRLAPGTILTAWLYQVARRAAIDVVRREARRQLREQIATEMNAMNATAADWTHIEPLLDEAMHALDDTDRTAVLLRYFENKSLREVGQTLGTSDVTAQKRVSRAVERLREFFAKRGVTVGTSGLAVVLSANAVQAAPVGLAVAISAASAIAGTTLASAPVVQAMAASKVKLITAMLLAGLSIPLVLLWHYANTRTRHQDELPQKPLAGQSADSQFPTINNASIPEPGSPEYSKLLHQMAGGKMRDAIVLSTALTQYVSKQGGQFPSSFDQIASYLHNLPALTGTNDFEIIYSGSFDELKRIQLLSEAVIRDRQVWLTASGKRARVYGMAGGYAEVVEADDSFQAWEARHVFALPGSDD